MLIPKTVSKVVLYFKFQNVDTRPCIFTMSPKCNIAYEHRKQKLYELNYVFNVCIRIYHILRDMSKYVDICMHLLEFRLFYMHTITRIMIIPLRLGRRCQKETRNLACYIRECLSDTIKYRCCCIVIESARKFR